MNAWHRSVPVCMIGNKMFPEFRRREPQRYDARATREKRGQKARKQSMYMEKGHHQQSTISWRQQIRILDVFCSPLVSVEGWKETNTLIVSVKFRCVRGTYNRLSTQTQRSIDGGLKLTAFGFPVVPLVCRTRATSSDSARCIGCTPFPASFPVSLTFKTISRPSQ